MKYIIGLLFLALLMCGCGNAVSGSAAVCADPTVNVDKLNIAAYLNGCSAAANAACRGEQSCLDTAAKFCADEKSRLGG